MTETVDAVEIVLTGPPEFIDQHCERLVQQRLVACAQVGQVRSTYRWEGRVEQDAEARAALHTVRANVAAVTRLTLDSHPYDVPCVLVLPIQVGNPEYLRWISDSVALG